MNVIRSARIFSGWILLVCCAFLAAGCQTSDTTLRNSGKSEAYITGFHDGRHSGMKEAGNYLEHLVKDEQRFKQDTDYRAGWLAGEQEGISMQRQADAAVGSASGARIVKEADKSADDDIRKAGEQATQNIDTESLKDLK